MNVVYLNTFFDAAENTGGMTHIREFIQESIRLGHTIWAESGNQHPQVKRLPENRLKRLIAILNSDMVYFRYDGRVTKSMDLKSWKNTLMFRNSIKVMEFNTIPDFGLLLGTTKKEIGEQILQLKRNSEYCDLAVCVTEEMANYYKTNVGYKNIYVLSNGSNPDHFKPVIAAPKRMEYFANKVNVVWAGSLNLPWSDKDLFLRAARYLWEQNNEDIFFHIIGDSDYQFTSQLPPNVCLVGKQSYEVLPGWLSAMDIGLMLYRPGPSDYGSPIKLFDYMASGLTVISSEHPQTSRIFAELDQQDLLLHSSNEVDLANMIVKLAENPSRIKQQGEKSRALVLEKYNWGKIVDDLYSAVMEVKKN